MRLRWAVAAPAYIVLVGSLLAFEATGTIQKVDAERGTLVIRVNGQDRTVKANKSIKVLDKEGKELADGLKARSSQDP